MVRSAIADSSEAEVVDNPKPSTTGMSVRYRMSAALTGAVARARVAADSMTEHKRNYSFD